MSNDELPMEPAQALIEHAEQLNAWNSPGLLPNVFYDLLSGAIIWSDETDRSLPIETIWALRYIFAYRTSLMLNKPREELKPMWDLGLTWFPKWVGFLAERREPTPQLLQIYRRGNVSSRKCLRDLEREAARQDAKSDSGNAS